MALRTPTLAVVGLMVLAGFVVPLFHSPAALAYGAVVTLALSQLKDRRTALGLAGVAVVAFALAMWFGAQPGYVPA